jgi:hypothetical protein
VAVSATRNSPEAVIAPSTACPSNTATSGQCVQSHHRGHLQHGVVGLDRWQADEPLRQQLADGSPGRRRGDLVGHRLVDHPPPATGRPAHSWAPGTDHL